MVRLSLAGHRAIRADGAFRCGRYIIGYTLALGPDAGGIIGDLTSRRGQVSGQEPRGNAVAIQAFVPLANMFGYINTLRSMSSGRAQFTMQFDHYEGVPQNISDEIQKKYA